MKRLLAVIMFTLSIEAISYAQEPTPDLLVQAVRCLAAKDFLELPNTRPLKFGYVLDVKSYPGQKVIYAVNYTGHNKSKGLVFVLFLKEQNQQTVFNIQNNATFIMVKRNVKFTGEALGGVWTHQHIEDAIKQIERQPNFVIPVENLRAPATLFRCESYTDKQ